MMPEAVILVGGEGRRLRSEVADRPKPLAWVGGRFFLSHLLHWLREAGVARVILAVGYRADMVQQIYGDDFLGMSLAYSVESTPLGTGGALREAAKSVNGDHFLALNGDSWCPIDLRLFVDAFAVSNASALLVTQEEIPSRYGNMRVDSDGKVERFSEKKGSAEPIVRNLGIYIFAKDIFSKFAGSGVLSLEEDIFPPLAESGKLEVWDAGSIPFIDIGLPESLIAARQLLLRKELPTFHSLDRIRQSSAECAVMLAERKCEEITGFKVAVGVIVRDKAGRILLELREDCGLWGTPGGRMDYGESAEETGVREVFEETCLIIQMERFVGVYTRSKGNILTYANGDVVQPITIVFEASIRGGELRGSSESLDLQFFDETQLPANLFPSAQEYLLDCLGYSGCSLR